MKTFLLAILLLLGLPAMAQAREHIDTDKATRVAKAEAWNDCLALAKKRGHGVQCTSANAYPCQTTVPVRPDRAVCEAWATLHHPDNIDEYCTTHLAFVQVHHRIYKDGKRHWEPCTFPTTGRGLLSAQDVSLQPWHSAFMNYLCQQLHANDVTCYGGFYGEEPPYCVWNVYAAIANCWGWFQLPGPRRIHLWAKVVKGSDGYYYVFEQERAG